MLPILPRSGPRASTGGGPYLRRPAAREMLWVAADRPVMRLSVPRLLVSRQVLRERTLFVVRWQRVCCHSAVEPGKQLGCFFASGFTTLAVELGAGAYFKSTQPIRRKT